MKGSYLCIGHICMDIIEGGFCLGGTASYVSKLTKALKYETSIISSYGPNFLFLKDFSNINLYNLESEHSTIFENDYSGEIRKQILHARASRISLKSFDSFHVNKLPNYDIIHFCPIADEVDFAIIESAKKYNCLSFATPQGWMRKWDNNGRVTFKKIDWRKLKALDFVIISEEDIPNLKTELPEICSVISKLIVTRGANGASVFLNGIEYTYPAIPTNPVDTTGAGDTFACAFITTFHQTKNIAKAMECANKMAALSIEKPAMDYLIDLETE